MPKAYFKFWYVLTDLIQGRAETEGGEVSEIIHWNFKTNMSLFKSTTGINFIDRNKNSFKK